MRPYADANYARACATLTQALKGDMDALDQLLQSKVATCTEEDGDQVQPSADARPQMAMPHVPPLHKQIGTVDVPDAKDSLCYFAPASDGIALLLLVLAGLNELYAAKVTFGANPRCLRRSVGCCHPWRGCGRASRGD